MDSQQLIKKYNELLKKQKTSEAKLIELRTKYKYEKSELDKLIETLKSKYNVETIDDAKNLLEKLKFDLEMELSTLEDNLKDIPEL